MHKLPLGPTYPSLSHASADSVATQGNPTGRHSCMSSNTSKPPYTTNYAMEDWTTPTSPHVPMLTPTMLLMLTAGAWYLDLHSYRLADQQSQVGYPQPRPAQLKADNNSAIVIANNSKGNSCIKHIVVCHHYICKCIEEGDIDVEYVPSAKNIPDIFTKPLPRPAHHKLCLALRLCEE